MQKFLRNSFLKNAHFGTKGGYYCNWQFIALHRGKQVNTLVGSVFLSIFLKIYIYIYIFRENKSKYTVYMCIYFESFCA